MPLLIETHAHKMVGMVVVVSCSPAVQVSGTHAYVVIRTGYVYPGPPNHEDSPVLDLECACQLASAALRHNNA
jgi:hypothetical protein